MAHTAQNNRRSGEKRTGNTRTIAIFGSSSADGQGKAYRAAYDLGYRLAEAGFEVLNGGYDGLMAASSRGAKEAGGTTIGVTCPTAVWAARGQVKPNGFLDENVPAPDILSRIDIMMRQSGGYVFFDGGTGTLSELGIVWEFVSKGLLPPRPIVLAGRCWDALADEMATRRSSSAKHLHRTDDVGRIVEILEEHAVGGTRARALKKAAGNLNDDNTTVSRLRRIMERFIEERRWEPFHDPKNLSASIAIEAAELMEHFQWLRSDELDSVRDNPEQMQAIREEAADVFAYLLSFAGTMGIDLASALADKMKKNALKYPVDQYRGRFE